MSEIVSANVADAGSVAQPQNTDDVAQVQDPADAQAQDVAGADDFWASFGQPPKMPPGYFDTLRKAVEDYHTRGFATTPIACGDKRPQRKEWNLWFHEIDEYNEISNVGIMTGTASGDLVCIDLDSAAAVAKADQFLPPTNMVEGRPGKPRSHRYYMVRSIPPDLIASGSASGDRLGGPRTVAFRAENGSMVVEILGTGRHATAPPSRHESGEHRVWDVFGEPEEIDCLELYRAVERLAVACGSKSRLDRLLGTAASSGGQGGSKAASPTQGMRAKTPVASGERQYLEGLPPMEERVRRARAYLTMVDRAVSGQKGHNQTYKAACIVVRDFAVDPDQAWELLKEFNKLCKPQWTDAELAHKLEGADAFDGERGSKLVAGMTERSDGNDNGEQPNDPHRLARLFLDQDKHDDGPTWTFWRDEWWHWDGRCFVKNADKEFKALLTGSIRTELAEVQRRRAQALTNEYARAHAAWTAASGSAREPQLPRAPVICPVTTQLVNNTALALSSMVLGPYRCDQPVWFGSESHSNRKAYLGLQNGLLDIPAYLRGDTHFLWPHTPRWFSPVCLSYGWESSATCSRWLDALNLMFGGDPDRIAVIQEWFGYCLVPTTDLQRFLMLVGEGHNGKSVICAALTAMLGDQNVSHVALEAFEERFALAGTLGKLANIAAEVGELDKTAEGKLKQFTSGDRMTFDRKGLSAIQAVPTARLVLATNNPPRFSDKTEGVWRRLLLVPCNVVIPAEKRVRGMDKPSWWEASGELPGMLPWALEGLRRLKQRGEFTPSGACRAALTQYRLDSDPARVYLLEHCAAEPSGEVPCAELYQDYSRWCEANGFKALASNKFGGEVRRAFPKCDRQKAQGLRKNRDWCYQGIVLQEPHNGPNAYSQCLRSSTN